MEEGENRGCWTSCNFGKENVGTDLAIVGGWEKGEENAEGRKSAQNKRKRLKREGIKPDRREM